ncbi:DUF1570 domain-containing protein [Pedobacter sp. MW01-1-1]|uniref:DUF1570 domain-containing protein n=1 Tax=Pedobacter sp. MW01-1-1 TaxID=3383027 RepID=UPI003FF0F879
MRLLFLLTITLTISLQLQAQYVHIKTISCTIVEKEQKKIEKLITYQRMFYNEIFQTENNLFAPINITLYGKNKDFKAVKDSARVFKQADGFYVPQTNQAYLLKNSNFTSVCLHETSHSLFHSNSAIAPKWLNEGLAEFFETFDLDEKGALYSYPQSGRIKLIKEGIALNDTTRLRNFFKTNDGRFYKEDITDNYSTAYSIVFFFIKSKNSEALKNIIRLIKTGTSSEKAIALTYGGNFHTFEAAYNRFYYFYRGS